MRRTRHVVLPVRSWQHVGLMMVSLSCLTLGLVSRDREGQAGNLAGPDLQHCAPHKVDACPNVNALTSRFPYDDSASPSGIILTDQSNDHRITEVRNAPEIREIRNSRSPFSRVSRIDVGRISGERRDERRARSLDRRRSAIGNNQERRDEERNRESRRRDSQSVDRNSRLRVRGNRERDSSSYFSEIGADRRAQKIRTSEPLHRRTGSTRTTREDREDRRRRDNRSLKREIVKEYSRSDRSEDHSARRRDDRRSRRVSGDRNSETSTPRRVISERIVRREIRESVENSFKKDRAIRRNRIVRSLDRDSRSASYEAREERRIVREARDSRKSRDSDTMRESRIRDAGKEESRISQLREKIIVRISNPSADRRRVREIRSTPRKTIDNFVTERREHRRIKSDVEIGNRRFLDRDSRTENRRSSLISTGEEQFLRTNSLRSSRDVRKQLFVRQDGTPSVERSSNQRLEDLDRSNSKRRIEGMKSVKIDRIRSSGTMKEDAMMRLESRSRSRSSSRRSEPTRFAVSKNWEDLLSTSSSIYYEGLKQIALVVLCLAYGVSLYGGKGSLSRNIMGFANRLVVW